MSISSRYSPKDVEKKIYTWWEKNSYFKAKESSSRPSFCTLMPPPNVTGSLHMGHALDHTLQDTLVRWKRMQGFNSLWLPGTDHAGIATQSVVERELAKKGLNRKEMGEKAFLNSVWAWKDKHEKRIIEQCRRLGDSCDWEQSVFTLEEKASLAVRKAFVSLYKKSWVYKGKALIHWSPQLGSALSDLEVEHKEVHGNLWFIRYPLQKDSSFKGRDSQKESLTIATTRPETLLADTAVAVHPEDERWKSLIGQRVELPLTQRSIPVMGDRAVDRELGSGALKITPGHDFNDFEIGKRHHLESINLLHPDGTLNQQAGSYEGLTVTQARQAVVKDLEAQGLLLKVVPHSHSVGHCSRTGCVVEPLLSEQWFVRVKPMALLAQQAVETGQTCFEPKASAKTYLHWMDKIQDWCVSRQLWWGHRIPAWHCQTCSHIHVSEEEEAPSFCKKCGGTSFTKETDVLDTWFSSALWPITTMGWPEKTEKQKIFYPTDVLITGHDIIFFWVARMMMMGLEFKKEVPFKTVYLHGLVRDSQGRKMSKSLGNTLDPLKMIDSHGADALRFSLLSQTHPGRDIKFSLKKLDESRNFTNKLWNAARFSLEALKDFDFTSDFNSHFPSSFKENTSQGQKSSSLLSTPPPPSYLSSVNQWMMCQIKSCEIKMEKDLVSLDFFSASQTIHHVVWYEFCDWYLEWIKPVLYGPQSLARKGTQLVLAQVFHRLLRLLHPFMPFITEEIYQKMTLKKEACMIDSYPCFQEDKSWFSKASEEKKREVDFAKSVVISIRNIRGENRISPGKRVPLNLIPHNLPSETVLKTHQGLIQLLGKTSSYEVGKRDSLSHCALSSVHQDGEQNFSADVVIPLMGLVDFDKEIRRMTKNLEKLEKERRKRRLRLSSSSFSEKAPKHILDENRYQLKTLSERVQSLKKNLSLYKGQQA